MVTKLTMARSPIVLTSERLVLTLPGPARAAQLVSYFETNRAHLTPWEPPFPRGLFTNAFWEKRLVQSQREYQTGTSMRLVIWRRDAPEGPVVGLANFTQFVRGAFMGCNLGYSLDADAQGQGYMYEALKRALDHVFGPMGMHRVSANYLPINERSGRLLRRLGFTVEGYARDYIYIDGAWRDHVLTSLTNPDTVAPDYLRPKASR